MPHPHGPGAAPPRQAPIVSRSTGTAIRRAVNAAADGWLLDDHVRRAGRMVAEDARRHGLRAEQMLVELKREWPSLAGARALPQGAVAAQVRDRLVTHCIHEYYAASRG